jgi:transposase
MVSQRQSQGCLCQKYLDLLAENARLKEQIERLQSKLARQQRTAKEQPFGLSTPSSKKLIKPSLPQLDEAEMQRRKGGAMPGHVGYGWKEPDGVVPEIEELSAPDACPCCGGALVDFPGGDEDVRELIDCHSQPAFRRRVRVPVRYCPHCRKPVRPRISGVLPKTRLCNSVLARAASEHYLDGVPMGTVVRRLGVTKGAVFNEMHRLAELFDPAYKALMQVFRNTAVKFADETPWRTDGNNGYAWLFLAGPVRLFVCEESRAMSVPAEVLADSTGTLMTDRYAGYNCFRGKRGYCFEHLKRDTLEIVEDNPKSAECLAFAEALVPLLATAMSLRTACVGDPVTYFVRAASIRHRIEEIILAPARHPSVQNVQNIFRDNEDRLWHWTEDTRVPVENNTAERGVRPLAIARKVSHGSQSVKGRETRSVLMSVLHTLDALCMDPANRLKVALDHYAQDPNTDVFKHIFGGLLLHTPMK